MLSTPFVAELRMQHWIERAVVVELGLVFDAC